MPAKIHNGFWSERLAVNAGCAIFHQWEQLEASGCIHNFHLVTGQGQGFREGWFFADSDAYKWLDAACCIWKSKRDARLGRLMDDFIRLLGRAQAEDGYLYTYNMLHFPDVRWENLHIEHELYCHGHLIEAGVSHFQATGREDLLRIARKAADRIVADFKGKGTRHTPGHEEIEIALLRLHEVAPGDGQYLQLARQFLERRGRNPFFGFFLAGQLAQVARRRLEVKRQKEEYMRLHPEYKPFQMPRGNKASRPPNSQLRWLADAVSGKYFQQHQPVGRQNVPVGHAVRFAYLQTAAAALAGIAQDRRETDRLERTWERMVTRRMFVTGGIGSLPGSEGFGRDYELNPEYAYAETCAALGSIFWCREMSGLTGKARYSDLAEWQLYNAAGVGMGLDGKSYLYNNPLESRGGIERKAWYAVPCCPSNISRTWANLGEYISRCSEGKLYIEQYISSRIEHAAGPAGRLALDMASSLPWDRNVTLTIDRITTSAPVAIVLRVPSWARGVEVAVNGIKSVDQKFTKGAGHSPTASGFDPRDADWIEISHAWKPTDRIDIRFEMPIILRRAHPRVEGHAGKAAITRGPLVYCLESVDNPGMDIFTERISTDSIHAVRGSDMTREMIAIEAASSGGKKLRLIPYFCWGNRGASHMTVWINTD